MRTLDRYILRYFFLNLAILFVIVNGLFILIDLILNLDEFIKAAADRADTGGGMLLAFLFTAADFYAPMVTLLFVYFSGLLVTGAVMFTLAWFARTRELVAMIASGISLHRVAIPVLIAGAAVNALTILDQEYVIPPLAPKLLRSQAQVGRGSISRFPVTYSSDKAGNLVSAAEFDPISQAMTNVAIVERDADGRSVDRITADRASWDEQKQGWSLSNGKSVRRAPPSDQFAAGNQVEAQFVEFFPTTLTPQVLLARRASSYPRLMSLAELQRMKSNRASDQVMQRLATQIMHTRFSLMIVNVLILVIALPFFLLREPANLLLQGVKAACVTMTVWGAGLLILEVGSSFGNPVTAAWLPVVFLLPFAAWMTMRVRT